MGMKITLQVNGREMTFSEEELAAILEEHFSQTQPTEPKVKGKYFNVIPNSIDRSLFQEKRANAQQEWTRQIIEEAFDEVDKYPEKYAKAFKVMIPEKMWSFKTVRELKKLAKNLGNHIANWVEQALVWAQRISNGETWEAICNDPDTEKWYRLVEWKNGYYRLVGGSVNGLVVHPASYVRLDACNGCDSIIDAVPAVVCYDEDCPVPDRMAS